MEPCDLPDDIQLAYVDDQGRRCAVALEDAARLDFSLPHDVCEQANWGRLLSDPDWGSPLPLRGAPPRKIPFIDIADSHERSAA